VDADNDPSDLNGHGTHVAGTIGARGGDATGVAGVAWDASIMPLRILDANGSGTVADAIEAYEYAASHGARVLNASFGSTGYSLAEHQAIQQLPEVLFVVAAGNDGTDNDVTPHYPCAYPVEHLVCVAASNQSDRLAGFSNYGVKSVDLAAPGTNVLSSLPGGGFGFKNGTSMATPQVAGAAALVFAQRPTASAVTVKRALLAGAEPNPALAGKISTGARLNAMWALVGPPPAPPESAPPGTAPAPAPTPAPDRVAPGVVLRMPRTDRVRTVLRRGIRVRVTCSEACLLGAKAYLRNGGTQATRSGQISGRGTRTLAIRLGPHAKQRLRHVRRATVSITIRATDPAGNTRSLRRVLRVERGR
jgi:subtilisin family serine protease